MDKFRLVLEKIQTCIEMQNGATESQLKDIWNDLSEAITENEDSKAVMIEAIKGGCLRTELMTHRNRGAAIVCISRDDPIGIMALPADPFIITKLPNIEQPQIISIKEAEEPFYMAFDKRRGKRKCKR